MEVFMELDIQSIGKRIKKRRKELHLTQTEIKEKTGISSGNMSDIERGNRLPAATTLAQLSEILDCSIDWILTGKSPVSENLISPDIGEKDQKLLSLFHEISEEDQEELLMIAQLKYNRTQKSKEAETTSSLSRSGNDIDEIA
jgi:transcriptional regulator with XRE-family HTH domain